MYYDLYTVYESVGWLYRLMGCFPYVLSGPKKSRCYVLSTIAVTFNILFFIMGAKYFYDYLNMVKQRFMFSMDDDSLSILILALRQFFSIVCILDAMILKIFYSKQIILSTKQLAIQDEVLKSFGYQFKYKQAAKLSFIVVIIILLISYSIINLEFLTLIAL
ncbi:uncharacterized protein LOC131666996 [Phymastichus coffea]|uniref:uncharacterized protein LOC131666996 n=1 Tax=Phymastichus coffea TaxID=108790 RepID=UPI00273B49E0|nr:uncharacterized protein LOC131666996 [Phymastichus coffea]